jgi:hypothetical protein
MTPYERKLPVWAVLALLFALVMLATSGCASDTWVRTVPNDRTVAYNPEAYAGITKVHVEKNADGSWTGDAIFGKEYASFNVHIDDHAGVFDASASQVAAFKGQEQRAIVEAAYISVLAKWPDIASKSVEAIRETVAGYVKTLGLASGVEAANVAAGVVGKIAQARMAQQAPATGN